MAVRDSATHLQRGRTVTESRCPACTCIGFHTSDCTLNEMTLQDNDNERAPGNKTSGSTKAQGILSALKAKGLF